MLRYLYSRITVIWLLLVLATLLSWSAGTGVGHLSARAAGVVAIIVAFVKARFVALDFMEVRSAPLALRLFVEAWIVLVGGALVVLTG